MNRKLFLMEFFHESISNQSINRNTLLTYDIHPDRQYALLRLSFLDNLEKHINKQKDPYTWKQSFHNTLIQTVAQRASMDVIEMFILEPYVRTFVLSVPKHINPDVFHQEMKLLFVDLQKQLDIFDNNLMFMIHSELTHQFVQLSTYLKQLRKISQHSYCIGYKTCHNGNQLLNKINTQDQTMYWIQHLDQTLLLNTYDGFITYINDLNAYHHHSFDNNELVQFLHKEILIRLLRYAEKNNLLEPETLIQLDHRIHRFKKHYYSLNAFIQSLNHFAELLFPNNTNALKTNHPVVQRVIKDINRFYASEISLKKTAISLNMSESHLSRLIKQELNTNFRDLLLATRIRESKKLLIETNRSIETIAKQVGYSSAISFDRQFKKHENMTPSRFRILAKVDT